MNEGSDGTNLKKVKGLLTPTGDSAEVASGAPKGSQGIAQGFSPGFEEVAALEPCKGSTLQ